MYFIPLGDVSNYNRLGVMVRDLGLGSDRHILV
jgi:hypothetical protein